MSMNEGTVIKIWEDSVGDSGIAPTNTELTDFANAILESAGFNAKVQELAKRLLDEDITDSLDIMGKLADGTLRLI